MSDHLMPLASDFAAATTEQWRGLVDKILKGADFERTLVTRTADGLTVRPLYARGDAQVPSPTARGHARPLGTWDIRQRHADDDAAKSNEAILDDLKGGVSSIILQIAAPGAFGLDYHEPSIARALEGVMLDACAIVLEAGEYTPDCAGSLIAIWRKAGLADSQCQGAFSYDPLGSLAATGGLYQPLDTALDIAADLVRTSIAFPHVSALLANGSIWHDGGASEAQELACVFASFAAYLRACDRAGLAPAKAFSKIAASVAIDADQFMGVAKLRALRIGLARIADVCGVSGDDGRVHVTAQSSWRMMTTRDPWVNMLRATVACAAGAIGGADAITVLPFTWPLGRPDGFARRIARNTQIVLQEESALGRVQDPAGGSWYVEALSNDLAAAAWTLFQEIEAEGGLGAALLSGHVQDMLGAQAITRRTDVARGTVELTGTSAFPRLGDDGVTVQPWPRGVLSADLPGARAQPLVRARLSEPFERLREAADVAAKPPRVFLATLGPLAGHAARATWTRNFLAAGGIEAVGDAPLLTSAEAGRAFADSGCSIACLCGSNASYDDLGDATASLLKTAGATRVYMAGRQKDEAPWRAAGVDGFIFAGADMIELLTRLQTDLGIKAAP